MSLFWLGKEPMVKRKEYLLKLGPARVTARLEEVLRSASGGKTLAESAGFKRVAGHVPGEVSMVIYQDQRDQLRSA